MKRLLRVLVLTGVVFLFIQGTGTRVAAQYGTSDESCCSSDKTHTAQDTSCGQCKGPSQYWDGGSCLYAAEEDVATDCDENDTGELAKWNEGGYDCLFQSNSTCLSGDSCPTSYTNYVWDDDINCEPDENPCGWQFDPCTSNGDCCPGLYCPIPIGIYTCQPCVWNKDDPCGNCGTVQCDGSCNDPCAGSSSCASNTSLPCGSCGTYECDGTTCDDPCPGDGGGGGGGAGGDPCGGCSDGSVCFDMYYEPIHAYLSECEEVDPVIVSLDGSLFPLTNAADGVRFDFYGDNKPQQMSWTAAGAKVGWLALDLNRDGLISSGLELFSNVTPQPGKAGTHLGFRALAQWDKPTMGGNGDGQITLKDYVFSRLRVWVDSNHNGISEPGELFTMEQAGIQAISVQYLPDNWTDQYGNRFRNRAQVTWSNQNHGNGKGQGGGGGKDQWAYDVVLLSTTAK